MRISCLLGMCFCVSIADASVIPSTTALDADLGFLAETEALADSSVGLLSFADVEIGSVTASVSMGASASAAASVGAGVLAGIAARVTEDTGGELVDLVADAAVEAAAEAAAEFAADAALEVTVTAPAASSPPAAQMHCEPVPEPSAFAIFGLLAMCWAVWRLRGV